MGEIKNSTQSFQRIKLFWKAEYADGQENGPLYFLGPNGETENYESTPDESLDELFAKWFSLDEAKAIANATGLDLEIF